MKVMKWARLTQDHRFLQTMHALYITSLCREPVVDPIKIFWHKFYATLFLKAF